MPLTPPDTTPATAAPSKDLRYTIAVIASVAGVGWMVEFPESFAHTPFLVAGAAGALVLLFGGMPGIIFTQVVTLLATIWFVIPPTHSFRIAEWGDAGRLGIFVTLFAIADVLSWKIDRNRAEAAKRQRALHESEARHRLILERASDGIVVASPDGMIDLVNPRLCEMLGYTEPELLQQPVASLYAGGEHEVEPLWAGMAPEATVVLQRRLRRKDGSTFMAEWSLRRTADDHVQAIVRDVSVRHAAETAIRSERDLLDGILATSVAGILVVTPEGKVVFLNPTARAILGVAQDQMPDSFQGRPGWRFLTPHGESLPDAQGPLQRVLETGEPVQDARLMIVQRSGAPRTYSVNAAPLRDVSGAINAVVVSIADITAEAAAQKALRDREEQLEQVTSAVPGVVYQYLAGPDGNGRFAFVSRGARELLGASAEAILADPEQAWARMEPEERQALRADFLRASRTLAARSFDFRVRGPDGGVRWLRDWATAARSSEEGWVTWSGVIVDITERQRLEDELRQAQKMESLGRLAGGVAHDFNNLLTLVRGYAEMLTKQLGEGNALAGPVSEIRRAADRAGALTRQLLAVSRRQVLQPREVNLDELARDMERMLQRVIGDDVVVRMEGGAGTGLVRADPGQLEQVLLNLAVNSRDAMPKGGTLTLETSAVTVAPGRADPATRGVAPGDYVVLRVTDTGTGMSRETQSMIFEPFFTTKRVGEGTGLGLSTVYGIVQQSNGYITVQSELEKGTTFRIFLPRLPSHEEAPRVRPSPPPTTAPQALPGTTVLVVEDDDGVRQLTRRVLGLYGYAVLEARSGAEALELLGGSEQRVAAVVSDMMMPGMSGAELAAEVRRRWPGLPVLFLSGYTGADLGEAGVHGPLQRFLQKPYSPDALAVALQELLTAAAAPPTGPATAA
jgi:PAS domain S-box-containing protein